MLGTPIPKFQNSLKSEPLITDRNLKVLYCCIWGILYTLSQINWCVLPVILEAGISGSPGSWAWWHGYKQTNKTNQLGY